MYLKQLAETLFGPGAKGQAWAKQMRKYMKTKSDGITWVSESAAALRRRHGLWGQSKVYDQAYAYLKKRTHWMRYRQYSRQGLPIGSGITEARARLSLRSGSSVRGCPGR